MKRAATLLALLMMTLAITAGCGKGTKSTDDTTPANQSSQGNKPWYQIQKPDVPESPAKPSNPTTPTTPKTPATPSNPGKDTPAAQGEFNNNTPQVEKDNVCISPKRIFYKDGALNMEAYVTNGRTTEVYTLRDITIELYDGKGVHIASGYFSAMNDLRIPAGGTVNWTFIFAGEDTLSQNADFSTVRWECTITYNYATTN